MGKQSGKNTAGGTFVKRELFESKAFLSLSGIAPQVLIIFLGKRWFEKVGRKGKEKWICNNCDDLIFTYIEAEKKYGITKSRFSRAIKDLLEKGFISMKHKGGGYQKDKSVYAISDNWRLWEPGIVFEKRVKESVQRGFCKPNRKNSTSNIVPLHNHENEPKKMILQQ
jgi:hypothetical protein